MNIPLIEFELRLKRIDKFDYWLTLNQTLKLLSNWLLNLLFSMSQSWWLLDWLSKLQCEWIYW